MSFFKNFPFVSYNFGDEINSAAFQNLTAYVDIVDQFKDDLSFYELYHIKDNERPDNLSYQLYGTQDYYWTFYLLNDKLRQQGWPLSESEIFTLSKKYYPNTVLSTNRSLHGKFYVGDIVAREPFSNPPFKAKILSKDLDLGQIIVKPILEVRSITLNSGGSGYTSLPTITFSGGSGSGAKAAAVINASGNITSITVTEGGDNYISAPTVTISSPTDPSGNQATATAVLSSNTAAFISETVRSGIMSVSKGQREASQALGLKNNLVLRLIVIPQALRVIIPPLTSQYLNLTKNSSLGIAIGYADLVHGFGGISLNQTGKAIEIMSMVMVTYLTISLTISLFMNIYNKAVQFKGNA